MSQPTQQQQFYQFVADLLHSWRWCCASIEDRAALLSTAVPYPAERYPWPAHAD